MTLTTSQRQYLRRIAQALRATVQIGKQGVTQPVMDSIEVELQARELVKLKFMDFRDEKQTLAQQIASDTQSELVALIGNTAIVYREQRDPEKRKVLLPR